MDLVGVSFREVKHKKKKNNYRKKVERVISNNFSKSRVVTERHGKNQKAIPAEHLRLATQKEVDRYLTKPNFLRILGSWLLPKGA